MGRTATVAVLLIVAVSVSWAQTTEDVSTSAEALGQPLPTHRRHGGCVMSEELQVFLGNTPPPGVEVDRRASDGRLCEIETPLCYYGEGEPDCYEDYVDTYNGGCNDPSEPFSVLPESFGQPLVIWGRAGTYLFSGADYRDTDWYEITLDQPTEITFSCIAEFPVLIYFIDGTLGCGDLGLLEYKLIDECVEDSMTRVLGPGTFFLFVAPQDFTGVPCGSDYVMAVHGYQPDPCVLECPDGSVIEGEPVCEIGYEDYYNGGCNFTPATFQPLDPSEGMIVVCGETGVYEYPPLCYRDLDWYEITPAEPSIIRFCAAAEFDIIIVMVAAGPDPMDPCNGSFQMAVETADACDAACIEAMIDPGRFWLIVSTVDWLPLECGSEYTMTLEGYTTAVEEATWGSVKALYR